MADAGVIIKADLKEEDLTRKIDKLVQDVDNKFKDMANKVDASIQKVATSLGNFKTIAQTNVQDIKNAFQQLGTTFDQFARAMEKAAAAASGLGRGGAGGSGGTGGANQPAASGTIAELKQQIEEQKKLIDAEKQHTAELQKKVNLLKQMEDSLRRQTTSTEKLRQQAVGMNLRNINSIVPTNTTEAENKLNRLKRLFENLKTSVRNLGVNKFDFLPESMWNRIQASIKKTERELERLKKTATMPATLNMANVMGMSEKTLNEISLKMKAISDLRKNTPINSTDIQTLNAEYKRLSKIQDEILGKNQQLIKSNNSLGRAFNYVKNRLAFALSIGAITNFTKQLYEIRGQYELLERSLGVLVNSFSKGSQIFAELNAMAIKSPYTLLELGTAAKQLTAYNFEAKEVVNTTKRLADIASALGVPIERLVYNLGQIRAQTVLTARDARDFANAGLAIVPELAKYYTELEGKVVSTADVFDRMKKKAVSYNDVMAVLNKVTDQGGKFFDFQAKQAGTLKVQLANLNLAWNNMLNSIGKSHQAALTAPIRILKTVFKNWNSISNALKSVAVGFGLVKLGQMAYIASTAKVSTTTAIATATNWGFVNSLVGIRNGLAKIMVSPTTWWVALATIILGVATAFDDAQTALHEFNKSIRDSAKENVESLTSFLKEYSEIRDKINNGNLDEKEANKAWEAIKEQIELTSNASEHFISNLTTIENINQRIQSGFAYIDIIKSVNAALQNLDDETIKINNRKSDWTDVLGAGAVETSYDGLARNVKRYTENLADAREEMEETGKKMEEFPNRVSKSLASLTKNLDITTESMKEFAKQKDWLANPEAITEMYGKIGSNIIQQGLEEFDWEPSDVFNFQLEWEEYRSKAAKEALAKRIANEEVAYRTAEDEKTALSLKAIYERDKAQLVAWEQNNGKGRILWADFCKWMEEEHNSEVRTMYNKMTDNGKKAIDYSSKEWIAWVDEMADKYAKEHKISHDEVFNYLKDWVKRANTWDIFIKLTISTGDEKSLFDELTEYDKAAEEAYGKQKRLRQRIDELDKDIDKKKKGKKDNSIISWFQNKQEELELSGERAKALREEKEALDDLAEAESKGGKSKSKEADAKKKETAANKANAAARRAAAKAQRQAETELQKAFKDELQILDKAQKAYSDLSKTGMPRKDALAFSTKGYEESIQHINEVFKKWGIQAFDLSKYAGVSNPREILNMLESQLNTVIAKAKPEEIKELEVKIKEIRLEAEKYDMKKITDGLNNELGKLKEEYELAVELDANPELGGVFADMMGISQDELKNLPRDYGQLMDKLQSVIDQKLGYGVFDLSENLNKEAFTQWIKERGNELDDGFAKALDNIREYANKARLDETKKITQEWNTLLEKYSEYEYKRAQIAKEAEREREIARKHGEDQTILNAINKKEQRRYAELDFSEFQKTSEWILATSDLSNLAGSAIQMLIDRINEYKRTAKNLEPKEILKMNNALRKLKREQMKKNPFKILSLAALDAQENMEQIQAEIDDVQSQIDSMGLSKKRKEGLVVSDEEKKKLEKLIKRLEYLRNLKEEAGKIPLIKKVEQVEKYVDLFNQFSSAFKSFADSTNSHEMKQVAKAVSDVVDVISGALQGSATTGSWWGAIIGGVTTALPKILDWASGNAEINKQVSESQVGIKRLTNFYKELEHAANQAYGAEAYGAQKTLIINKQLQLEELKRQLRLEKSRKKKYQDQSTIADLEGQIIDLKNEINEATNDIVNGLLGITSKADFAEDLVKSMIDAFKAGEDYMKVFEDSFEEMIDNMIMKAIVSRLVGDWINSIWDRLDQKVAQSDRVKSAEEDLRHAEDMLQGYEKLVSDSPTYTNLQLRDMWRKKYEEALAAYNEAITPTPEDIAGMREFFEQGRDDFKNNFLAYMDAFGIKFGEGAGKADLSALQQGIQGITEDTAGALEAYMNSVSQQVYLHSDLLTQIRDILINFGGDVTIATNAQILLQLQQSFQVQMTIQNVLTGVLNASGLAFRVELAN